MNIRIIKLIIFFLFTNLYLLLINKWNIASFDFLILMLIGILINIMYVFELTKIIQ